WSAPSADSLSGYYTRELAAYPKVLERFERLGLMREGHDVLAGCATVPIFDEQARPEGLMGVAFGPSGPAHHLTPPGQAVGRWLFPLEKVVYGLQDHGLVLVTDSVLSFFTLYSILAAVGLEVTVASAADELRPEALERLLALGAREIFVLTQQEDTSGLAGQCRAAGAVLHPLSPVTDHARALEALREVAAHTQRAEVRHLLEQLMTARGAPGEKKAGE
ncbi:MAG: hypothetical protein V2A77_07490, partial [Pseudomonadota bacterium]